MQTQQSKSAKRVLIIATDDFIACYFKPELTPEQIGERKKTYLQARDAYLKSQQQFKSHLTPFQNVTQL